MYFEVELLRRDSRTKGNCTNMHDFF